MAKPNPSIPLKEVKDENDGQFDSLVIVAFEANAKCFGGTKLSRYLPHLEQLKTFDTSVEQEGALVVLPTDFPVRTLVYSPIGPVNRDYDDVRRFRDAAYKGIKRALKAGAKKPVLILPINSPTTYKFFDLVTVLGAYEAIYVPLEIREAIPARSTKVNFISFTNFANDDRAAKVYRIANAIESGRAVARDIGGSDPERMRAEEVERYVKCLFNGDKHVKVNVLYADTIKKEFPCLAAVNRASVERHQARVLLLDYKPDGPVDKTLILVGKGVTYDTGGSDIKAGGIMAGMHRDKCGAAAVAGFFQTLSLIQPKGIRVLGSMSMVRNSIGPDGYVADEIIISRAGVRVRVGNTDAEGRMAMVDLLAYFKEQVLKENLPNPEFFTIATLTGHACLAVGDEYSIIMDNGPARKNKTAQRLQEAGDAIGDLFEISTIRREDYEFNKGKSEYEDILQCNNLPSSRTPRGHQMPAAFLVQVSGLDKHGLDSEQPLPYSHIDIAGSSGPFPGVPTGVPIAALATRYLNLEA